MKRRIRLLPVIIFAAGLTLTVKLGSLWQDMAVGFGTPTQAESKPAPAPAKPPEMPAKGEAPEGKKMEPAEKAPQPPKPSDLGLDRSVVTDEEMEVLQKLAERRTALEKREREFDLRQNLLRAAEKRIDSKLAELKKIQATIKSLLKQHDKEQEAKIKSLVKIYESMKPKEAAAIFERLDMPVVLDVIERMSERRVAPIMAKMDPAKAKGITTALAERRVLPKSAQAAAKPKTK